MNKKFFIILAVFIVLVIGFNILTALSRPKPTLLGSAIPQLELYSGIHELPAIFEVIPISADDTGRYLLDDTVTALIVCPILGHGSSVFIAEAQSKTDPIQIYFMIDDMLMSDVNVININFREMFPEGFEGTIWAFATNGEQGWYSEKLNAAYIP